MGADRKQQAGAGEREMAKGTQGHLGGIDSWCALYTAQFLLEEMSFWHSFWVRQLGSDVLNLGTIVLTFGEGGFRVVRVVLCIIGYLAVSLVVTTH